ncbi:MAG: alpha/beta hydrolase [Nitrospiraceae bacterium]|nr:alpha/beta hydrolase [Nitrospiraceae bacterium]
MSFLDSFFVYHPAPWEDRDWAKVSGVPIDEVWFQAADGTRLFGWYAEGTATNAVLLWCHGNAGNMIHRLENLRALYQAGLSVFLFDYRGYGRSQGRPTEDGLYADAVGAYDYLTRGRRIRPERLVIFGRSLGGAVAGELAVQKPAMGLVLESCFPSIETVARHFYMGLPVHWFLGAAFRLEDRLRRLSLPKLFIHGDRDDVIPIELGQRVFAAAKPPKEFYVVRGADHNNVPSVGGQPYYERFTGFCTSALRQ